MKTLISIIVALASQSAFGIVVSGPTENPANGHLYYIVQEGFGWDVVEAEAVTFGGHLATVSDADESAFVGSLIDGLGMHWAWIGLSRTPTSSFEWVSGEPFNFANWYPGEPNNAQGNEFYGIIYGTAADNGNAGLGHFGKWNDAPLGFTNRGVVEVIPEPSSALLACIGVGVVALRRRARQ